MMMDLSQRPFRRFGGLMVVITALGACETTASAIVFVSVQPCEFPVTVKTAGVKKV